MRYFILKDKKIPSDITYQNGNYKVIKKDDGYYRVDEFSDKRSESKINSNLDSIHNFKGIIMRGCINSEVKIIIYKDIFGLQQGYLICRDAPPIGFSLQEINDLNKSINNFVISD